MLKHSGILYVSNGDAESEKAKSLCQKLEKVGVLDCEVEDVGPKKLDDEKIRALGISYVPSLEIKGSLPTFVGFQSIKSYFERFLK